MGKVLRADRPIQTKIPEVGRLFKGGPKGSSQRGSFAGGDDYCSPYIRFEPDDRFKSVPSESHESLWHQLKDRWEELIARGSVPVRFPFAGIEENLNWSNVVIKPCGNTPKTFVRCDGVTNTRWTEDQPHPTKTNQKIPRFVEGERPCSADEDGVCPLGCKPRGTLKLWIPELYQGGVVIFPLNSPIDIQNLQGELLRFAGQDWTRIPFSLYRRADQISWEEKGEVKAKINWGLHIEIQPEIAGLIEQSRDTQFRRSLAAGVDILEGEVVDSPAIAPAQSGDLPRFKPSRDGIAFTGRIQQAIRDRDLDALKQAIEDAQELAFSGLYQQKDALRFIESEELRGIEAIRDSGPIKPAPELPLGEFSARLSAIREFTGHTRAQVKSLAQKDQLSPSRALTDKSEFQKMRRILLVDWAIGQFPIVWDDDTKPDETFDTFTTEVFKPLPDESPGMTDLRLMAEWKEACESIKIVEADFATV